MSNVPTLQQVAHFDDQGRWVIPDRPASFRHYADFTGAQQHAAVEPTHQSLARDLQLERAQLINLLVEARSYLAYIVGSIEHGGVGTTIYPHLVDEANKARAFLDRGLFGDKA